MTATVMDGAAPAARIREQLREASASGRRAGLGTILVGDDPASARYVALKHQDCEEVGIRSKGLHLPASASQQDVLDAVADFNADPDIDAYLVQLPLPKGLDEEGVLLAVDPDKDVDGLHPVNLGRLVMGANGPVPCTPGAIQRLLVEYGVTIEGRHVVIVGRGLTIGRPLALLLSLKRANANAAVTVVHTGVADLAQYTRQADILIAAAGSPYMITPDHVRPGAAVVGAGVTMDGKKLVPDVMEEVAEVAGWITPRVGGVGPMTRAMLLVNAVEAAQRHGS